MNYTLLFEIIKGTPLYVWGILVLLIYFRGIKDTKDSPLLLKKLAIAPIIFIVWGLDSIVVKFDYVFLSLLSFIFFSSIGTLMSYYIYTRYRKIYVKDSIIYRSGNYFSLIFILFNFFIRYIFHVVLNLNPTLYGDRDFNILYTALCGFAVGLFFGSLLQAYFASKKLKKSLTRR